MRKIVYILVVISLLVFSCGTQQKATTAQTEKEEPVRIANDSLEYEIIIIDPGFSSYLASRAKPMNFYSQEFLETRNRMYVSEWNNRARNPSQYNSSIYENVIDYQSNVDYGLEVNYKLFWYFQFAQRKYNMKLGSYRVYGN